jgi:hypothetical protein
VKHGCAVSTGSGTPGRLCLIVDAGRHPTVTTAAPVDR